MKLLICLLLKKLIIILITLCLILFFIDLTKYCREVAHCQHLQYFFSLTQECRLYLYIDANYPDKDRPIALTNNCFILAKRVLPWVLENININFSLPKFFFPTYKHSLCSIFSIQEQKNHKLLDGRELPNYQIAKN